MIMTSREANVKKQHQRNMSGSFIEMGNDRIVVQMNSFSFKQQQQQLTGGNMQFARNGGWIFESTAPTFNEVVKIVPKNDG